MSVSPEMMKLIGGGPAGPASAGSPPGAMPGAPATAGNPTQPPAAAPISRPQDKKGLKAAAVTNLNIAANMVEQAVTAFEPGSEEYNACLKVMTALSKVISKRDSGDLVPAEVMQMVRQMTQMGGGTDLQKQILQQMQQKPAPIPQQQ
jgi:hypothetical protein